ncbi:MAG: glycosyltransferase family 1 protein [Anaerolineae bacterium]
MSTRFAGIDGVSLETSKWAEVLEEMGHTCFYFAGLCDRPGERSLVVPEAFFGHPKVRTRHDGFWGKTRGDPETNRWLHQTRDLLRRQLERFVGEFKIDMLIVENVLAIPLNVPLGLALAELISDTGIPTIGHHHDLPWERERFEENAVSEHVSDAFPPDLPSVQHVVINSLARQELARRKEIEADLVPNVMNYKVSAPGPDEFSSDLRSALGLGSDERLILQPTRVIPRKGIEHAIELVSRLELSAGLVISHPSGDEGDSYLGDLQALAERIGLRLIFAAALVAERRGRTREGRKIYSLWDVYTQADLVTYPSLIEGFGNAFLEAVWFRKPIIVNRYLAYEADIRPLGFDVIEFQGNLTDQTVAETRRVLEDGALVDEMVERNYALARRHYSYDVLRTKLGSLVASFG